MRIRLLLFFLLFSALAFAENGLTPRGKERMDALINGDRGEKMAAARELQSIFKPETKIELEKALKAKFESMNKSMPQQLDEATVVLGGFVSEGNILIMYQITIPESEMTPLAREHLRDYTKTQLINQACTDEGQLFGLLAGMKIRRNYSFISGSKLFEVDVDLDDCINQ